jgi:16S rRNA (cytidine1402-2'-O)-methyltransferase
VSGTLYVVATPIGNLDDLSRRAERTLREVARVVAEDTRRTRQLLSHLGIEKKPLDRLDEHATPHDVARVIEALSAGQDVALVTDAGTPAISDPGAALAAEAARAGIPIVPIPGASAVLVAIAGSGFSGTRFRFFGFLPRSGRERDEAIGDLLGTPEIAVFFESPHRTEATLAELARAAPDRPAVVARELTKIHEDFVRGTLTELSAPREWLGEVTIVLGPWQRPDADLAATDETVDGWISAELAKGAHAKEAARIVAARSGRPRRELYARVLALGGK